MSHTVGMGKQLTARFYDSDDELIAVVPVRPDGSMEHAVVMTAGYYLVSFEDVEEPRENG